MKLTRSTWLLSYYILHAETIKCYPLFLTCGVRDLIELFSSIPLGFMADLHICLFYADVCSHVLVLHCANRVLAPLGMVHINH